MSENIAVYNIKIDENFISTFQKIQDAVKRTGNDLEKLAFKTKPFEDGIRNVGKGIGKKAKESMGGIGGMTKKAGAGIGSMAGKLAYLAAAYVTVGTAVKFFNDRLEKAEKQRNLVQKYADEQARYTTKVKLSNEEFYKQAQDLAKNTKFTTEQVMEIGVKSLRIKGIDQKKMKEAMSIAMGMSEREGISIEQSFDVVNKAMSGSPTEGLEAMRSAGVPVTKQMQALANVMEQTGQYSQAQGKHFKFLSEQYKGFAEEAASRDPMFKFNKSMEISKESMGKVALTFKQGMAPVMNEFAKSMSKVSDWISKNQETIQLWVNYVVELFNKFKETITPVFEIIKQLYGNMFLIFEEEGGVVEIFGPILDAIKDLLEGLKDIYNYLQPVLLPAMRQVVNTLKTMASLVSGIVKTVHHTLTGQWGKIGDDFSEMAGKIKEGFDKTVRNAKDAARGVKDIWDDVTASRTGVEDVGAKKIATTMFGFETGRDDLLARTMLSNQRAKKSTQNPITDNIKGAKTTGGKLNASTSGVGASAQNNISAASPKVFVLNINELNGIQVKGNIVGKETERDVRASIPSMITELTNSLAEIKTGNI